MHIKSLRDSISILEASSLRFRGRYDNLVCAHNDRLEKTGVTPNS